MACGLVQHLCLFHIQCVSEDADGIHDRVWCRHLNLPFAGLAVGSYLIWVGSFDVFEKRGSDFLRSLVVLAFEAIRSGYAAANAFKHGELYAWYHPQQLRTIHDPSHPLHVACGVISQPGMIVVAESQPYLAFVHKREDKSCSQEETLPHIAIVNIQ